MSKVSDNYDPEFTRMSDGRGFTDYRTNCITNNSISKNMSSWEYRYYLTSNAAKIAQDEKNQLENSLKYTGPPAPEVPVKNIQNCNKGFCTIESFNEAGLGLGKATGSTV